MDGFVDHLHPAPVSPALAAAVQLAGQLGENLDR
jgi:hypothetical protein